MRKAKMDSKSRVPVMAEEVQAKVAKDTLGTLLSRVEFGDERIPITRRGKKVAVLVSVSDGELLGRTA